MRKYGLCAAIIAALFVAANVVALAEDFKAPAPKTVKTSDGRELKLAWNDEFNGEGLPNPEFWSYEVGYIRNNEAFPIAQLHYAEVRGQ